MKLLRPLFKYLLFPLLLCWLFVVALVMQAPVGWLVWKAQQYQLLPAGISWQQLDGRLGQGQVIGLQMQGVELESVSWSLSGWRLLLVMPRLELQLGTAPESWILQLNVSPFGYVSGQLQPGAMDLLRGQLLPVSLQGQLHGPLNFAVQHQQGRLMCSQFRGELSGELLVLQPLQVELGQISFKPRCRTEQEMEWVFSSELDNQHQLLINGQLTAVGWSFNGAAEVKEGAEITSILQLLQWRRQPGGAYRAQGAGHF